MTHTRRDPHLSTACALDGVCWHMDVCLNAAEKLAVVSKVNSAFCQF